MSGYDVDVTDLYHFQFSSPLLHQEVRLVGIALEISNYRYQNAKKVQFQFNNFFFF